MALAFNVYLMNRDYTVDVTCNYSFNILFLSFSVSLSHKFVSTLFTFDDFSPESVEITFNFELLCHAVYNGNPVRCSEAHKAYPVIVAP
jgi:hypothetical protein